MIVFPKIAFLFVMACFGISVAPLQQEVEPYQTFHESYSVLVPKTVEKEDPIFLQALKEKSVFFPFLVKNVRVEGSAGNQGRDLIYQFSLLPRGPGKHYFSPGTIFFSGSAPCVFPVAEADVKSALPWTVLQERLLPLNPDQALSLSQKNYGLSFHEIAAKEQIRSERLYARRESTLAAITIFVLGLATAALLFWIICELELHKRLRPAVPKVVNWERELHRLLQNSSLPFRVRLQLLAQILPHVQNLDKNTIQPLLDEIEEIRFSGIILDTVAEDKCWQKITASLSVFLPK